MNILDKVKCHVLYSITYCFAIKCTNSYISTELTAQNINPRLTTKIVQYTKEGMKNVRELKPLLKTFVKNDLFSGQSLPDSNNQQYYPNSAIIRSHINRKKAKLRHSVIDQE